MEQYKAKFFGSKERHGQITKQSIIITADSESKVEDKLRMMGWSTIHGLKIRKA